MNDADVLAAVDQQTETALETMRFVHGHPELAHSEYECSDYLTSALVLGGFMVERGIAGMPTAFRATLDGARPGRSVGLAVLYDAVPAVRPDGSIEPVHSCGHGPISGGVVAAALALASMRDILPGSLAVLGCPADETHAPGTRELGGGKMLSAEAGIWDSLDAALYAHPESMNMVAQSSRWMRREHIRVSGTRSLIPGAPQPPLEAAAALVKVVRSLAPDEVMLERIELDGDIEDGAGLVLRSSVLVFGDDEARLEAATKELRASLPGAEWESGTTVSGIKRAAAVTAAVKEAFLAAGLDFVDDPPPLPFATDFGNLSRRVPSALIGIGRPGEWAFHTDEGARQFASEEGSRASLAMAKVLALSAVRLGART